MNRDRNIRAASMRMIELEIRNYHNNIKTLHELEEAIALPGAVGEPDEYVPSSSPGDPTPARALRLMSSTELVEMRRRLDAIEYMLEVVRASPEEGRYELIELAYWDGRYTVVGICDQLNISRTTFYRWRKEAIQLVASQLGWRV